MKPADVYSPTSEQTAPLPATVAEIGKIHFEGNIIPHSWYQRITLESGKPDMPAIVILAEIIYWYRPYQTLDKRGKPLLRKHFDGDMFQCTAAYFETKFGLTKDQARKALKRLEDAGYIRREYRSIVQQGILRNNIMFIEPVPLAVLVITHPAGAIEATSQQATPLSPVGDTLSPVGDTLSPVGDTLSPVGDTLSPVGDIFKGIETTTEITTEITTTTPNPSSSNERAAEPEAARGGGGVQDENRDSASDHGIAALESNEEQPATGGEVANERRAELAYPAKLTEAERDDIARQVCLLPLVIAQQMLDVVQSQIQSGQIKKNPAAVLRGIVRKYRADPAAFDPSSGFHVAEARRRRVEAEARLRAEAERRAREREALPAAPGALEVRSRSIASMLRSLRGH
jgi:hypothetical protein